MINYEDLIWQSSWNGCEVGYESISVIELYSFKINPNISIYIDAENERVLDVFCDCEKD